MNIRLTPELEKLLADKVASGRYSSPEEVVCEALRLLEWEEMSHKEKLTAFNRELQARMDAMDRGEYVTAEEARRHFAELSARRRAEMSRGERHS